MAVQGYQLVVFEWAMATVTGFFVAVRLYLRMANRLDREKQWFRWVDFWIVLAWLSFAAQNSFDSVLSHLGEFNENLKKSDSTKILINKIYYVEDATYLNTMYCVKCAMLCFFATLIPKEMTKTRVAMWITTFVVGLSWISGILMSFLWCQPVNRNWNINEKEFCSPLDSPLVVGWTIGWHITTDVMIYCLPISVIRTLSLPFKQKVGVAVTFCSGFACIFFACALLAASYVTVSTAVVYCFSTMEQTWAVLVACLPAFKVLTGSNTRDVKELTGASYWTTGSAGGKINNSNSTNTGRLSRSSVMHSSAGHHRWASRAESTDAFAPYPIAGTEHFGGTETEGGMGTMTVVEAREVDMEMAAAALNIGVARGSFNRSVTPSELEVDVQASWTDIDGTKLTVVDIKSESAGPRSDGTLTPQPSPLLPPPPVLPLLPRVL